MKPAPLGHRSTTRLLLARHGQTDYNAEGRLQGQIDIALNETGRSQAAGLARAMEQVRPDVIIASPLRRAHDTACAVGQAIGVDVTTDEALLERGFGPWEGLTPDEITQTWPAEYADFRAHRRVEGVEVEDRQAVADRVARACRTAVVANPGRAVLIVAHGAAITLGVTELLGLDAHGFRGLAGLSNCHYSHLEPVHSDPTGQLMRLVSHNLAPDFR